MKLSSQSLNLLHVGELASFACITFQGSIFNCPRGWPSPPFQLRFSSTATRSRFVASADEDGFLQVFDCNSQWPSSTGNGDSGLELSSCRTAIWSAHNNAIFDLIWLRNDRSILTASGDHSLQLWDVETRQCTALLLGHTGSVRSVSSSSASHYDPILASCSRGVDRSHK